MMMILSQLRNLKPSIYPYWQIELLRCQAKIWLVVSGLGKNIFDLVRAQ